MRSIKSILEKSRTIILLFFVVVLALLAGVVGELAGRIYLFDDSYNMPFFGNISFTDGNYNGANLAIIGAKKVVVEQNVKVAEAVNSLSNDLVGIFKKIKTTGAEDDSQFNIDEYYKIDQPAGAGLIITSDGWVITDIFSQNLKANSILSGYVIITKDRQIYEIDKIVDDPATDFSFIHAKGAKDFLVLPFAERGGIQNGQLAVAANWLGESRLTSIVGMENYDDLMKSSEDISSALILTGAGDKELAGSAIVDLSGNIIALANKQGKVAPITNFQSAIRGLLKNSDVKRSFFGVNYINLSLLAKENNKYKKGAVISKNVNGVSVFKGSPAEKAGLKEGDIITQIDNVEINENNDLADVIRGYLPGDKINLSYLREGEKREAGIELAEVK
jgi:S1-C subfamily serine protease